MPTRRPPTRSILSTRALILTPALLLALAAPACSSHYKVTDPASGRVYYTDDIDRNRDNDSIRFKDAKTKSEVTLQSSDVQKIDKKAYKEATGDN